ncbi:MAG: alanine--tRNA ligase [Phycisphaerales bacterium]|nr:alanine--tRNA ligase [Phycisphaerales bacterium]
MSPFNTDCPTAADIRRSFLAFFKDQAGHEIVPSSPVVPHDDPTLLFCNAGMNQFKDVFLSTGTRPWSRAVDSQKCIRAGGKHNDLEDVGRDTYHHTFFEMLGNWSFGDYFKAEAIEWAWTLLTEVWGLPKDRLHVTVFAGDESDGLGPDEEAETLWLERTDIDPSHITRWDRKDNFWEMGAAGPCGPCTEIHYDSTPDGTGGPMVNLDHPDVIEVWNLVFIQFNRREDGTLVPLPSQHVDTGMGLERIVRVLQNKRSNYDTDLWTPIFDAIDRETTAATYGGVLDDPVDTAYRVIADHVRCLTVALTDGARPGPDGRGYVLRRILRRGVRMARQSLGAEEPLLCKLVPAVVQTLGDAYPEVAAAATEVADIIKAEELAFLRTLDRGLMLFAEAAAEATATGGVISGEKAFLLHDTFGFPIDLTAQMAEEQSIALDRDGYEKAMETARDRSRGETGTTDTVLALPPEVIASLEGLGHMGTDDLAKFHDGNCTGVVTGIWNGNALIKNVPKQERVAVLLNRTSFYGEQGGQIGDEGCLTFEDGGVFRVEQTVRSGSWILHIGQLESGQLGLGDHVETIVDASRHTAIETNHTATHLLNRALREVLGKDSDQRGSLVAPNRLRFDYAASKSPSLKDIEAIEKLVQEDIDADLTVNADELPLDLAMEINGARAMFGERYPDPVRVVCAGAEVNELANDPPRDAWKRLSIEFCGGSHVTSTKCIGNFLVMQEQGLAAGIRRIVAITDEEAVNTRAAGEALLAQLESMRSIESADLPAAVDDAARKLADGEFGLVHRRTADAQLDTLRKSAKAARKAAAGESKGAAIDDARALASDAIGDIMIGEITASDRESLLAGIDTASAIASDVACLLACRIEETGKVIIAAQVPKPLIARGLHAGDWVRVAAQACGGGGGGRPDAAQAGGKNPEQLPEALDAAGIYAKEVLQ